MATIDFVKTTLNTSLAYRLNDMLNYTDVGGAITVGRWDCTVSSNIIGLNITTQNARYAKLGNLICVFAYGSIPMHTDNLTNLKFSLPFTQVSGLSMRCWGQIGITNPNKSYDTDYTSATIVAPGSSLTSMQTAGLNYSDTAASDFVVFACYLGI